MEKRDPTSSPLRRSPDEAGNRPLFERPFFEIEADRFNQVFFCSKRIALRPSNQFEDLRVAPEEKRVGRTRSGDCGEFTAYFG